MVFDSIIYSYGGNRVLRGIFLKVMRGSITGIFGVNGSGKSTLIRIGAGALQSQNGNIFIDDKSFDNGWGLERYKHIGYLSQKSFLPADITLEKLAQNIVSLKLILDEDIFLNKLKKHRLSSLSGGELRFLEIKLLFSLNRDYYLLDEPFTGIEPILIEKICELLKHQKELGKGILITDHYYRYVADIVDKAYLLKEGYMRELNDLGNIHSELIEIGYLPGR